MPHQFESLLADLPAEAPGDPDHSDTLRRPCTGRRLGRFHGVFALNNKLRALVTPAKRGQGNG